jgi:endo-1,4-beta-xylanase
MNQTIKSLAEVYGGFFPVGAAVNPWTIQSHNKLLHTHFNSITPENGMKFKSLHPREKEYEIIGPDYISKAFEYARRAAPEALLFYNDYNETVPAKRDKIYQLVKNLKEQGAPIDGIGLQGHWNIFKPSLEEIESAIAKYASLGLKLQITELDVSMFGFEDRRTDLSAPTSEMLDRQADFLGGVFKILRKYQGIITGVTFWGVADDRTWLDYFPIPRKNWPLLFDTQHQPKKAFWEIVEF